MGVSHSYGYVVDQILILIYNNNCLGRLGDDGRTISLETRFKYICIICNVYRLLLFINYNYVTTFPLNVIWRKKTGPWTSTAFQFILSRRLHYKSRSNSERIIRN